MGTSTEDVAEKLSATSPRSCLCTALQKAARSLANSAKQSSSLELDVSQPSWNSMVACATRCRRLDRRASLRFSMPASSSLSSMSSSLAIGLLRAAPPWVTTSWAMSRMRRFLRFVETCCSICASVCDACANFGALTSKSPPNPQANSSRACAIFNFLSTLLIWLPTLLNSSVASSLCPCKSESRFSRSEIPPSNFCIVSQSVARATDGVWIFEQPLSPNFALSRLEGGRGTSLRSDGLTKPASIAEGSTCERCPLRR
mmetsp:Transcript_19793/g.31035  ORF Transcript_19793/g.31035 Transcript_19793/m.31035 type:complete len:258 (+) Transcript_19793:965-1738(+)